MTIKALIFDFDGLIVDTEGPEWETWCAIYRSHGVELDLAAWQTGVGAWDHFDPFAHLEHLVGTAVDRERIALHQRSEVDRLCEAQPVLPGVLELLAAAEAAGLKRAVASSSGRDWVMRWLDHHDLARHFECVCTRDTVARAKPAPDLYLSAAACLGVPVEHCVALEDSPNGLQAALAAGMRCVVVPTAVTESLPLAEATLRVRSLADVPLPVLLERLAMPQPAI